MKLKAFALAVAFLGSAEMPALASAEKQSCEVIAGYAESISAGLKKLGKTFRDSGLDAGQYVEDRSVSKAITTTEFARTRFLSTLRDYENALEDLNDLSRKCAAR